MTRLLSIFRKYSRYQLRADLTAGLTVAMVAIPQSMVYAAIAGVNPVYGLFTAVIPAIIGALFGSYPYLVTGPTNPTALVTASVLMIFAGQTNYLEYVLALAIIAGLFKLIFGLFKLGSITKYISNSVLVGFLTAAGVFIIAGQLPNLMGITLTASGEIWETIPNLFDHLSETNIRSLIISLSSMALLILIRRINRKLPASLITIILATGFVYLLSWDDLGVRLVNDIGLPEHVKMGFHMPEVSWQELLSLVHSGAAVALFGLMETVSISKAMSQMSNERIDASREMVGQGLASIIGGFFLCMPSSGSSSRTVINVVNGAKTRVSSIISGLGVLVFLLLFTGLIGYIPIPTLAAVVVISSAGLINIHLIELTWQSKLQSRIVMVLTFISTLVLPLEYAIYLGILSTILIFLGESSHVKLNYIIEGEDSQFIELPMEGIEEHNPQIAIVNVEGDLYFAAVEDLQEQIEKVLETDLKVLILRFRRAHLLASTGIMALDQIIHAAREKGIQILFCGIQDDIQESLNIAGVSEIIGNSRIFPADHQLFRSTQQALDKAREILQTNQPKLKES